MTLTPLCEKTTNDSAQHGSSCRKHNDGAHHGSRSSPHGNHSVDDLDERKSPHCFSDCEQDVPEVGRAVTQQV